MCNEFTDKILSDGDNQILTHEDIIYSINRFNEMNLSLEDYLYHFSYNNLQRLQILYVFRDKVSKRKYNELLRQIFCSVGARFPLGIEFLIKLCESIDRRYFMNKDEIEYFNQLPEIIIVYRGIIGSGIPLKGVDWTLKKDVAIKEFAKNFGNIYSAKIKKNDIFAFVNPDFNEEFEIILNPNYLECIQKIS